MAKSFSVTSKKQRANNAPEQTLLWTQVHFLFKQCGARPDFAELDVFLGQHILYFLIQKFNLDYFPTPKPNLTHE